MTSVSEVPRSSVKGTKLKRALTKKKSVKLIRKLTKKYEGDEEMEGKLQAVLNKFRKQSSVYGTKTGNRLLQFE